jgi:hypothetical protein
MSRVVSDWSQFSGFTYYTEPTDRCNEEVQNTSGDVNVQELEEIVRGLDLEVKFAVMKMKGTMADKEQEH